MRGKLKTRIQNRGKWKKRTLRKWDGKNRDSKGTVTEKYFSKGLQHQLTGTVLMNRKLSYFLLTQD